jgi:pilus assembly protein CpaB
MDRNTRTLIVVLVALVAASAASYGVYRAIGRPTVKEVEVAHTFVVVAARTIPVGVRVAAADLKVIPWPEKAPVPGSFPKIDPIVGRGAVTQILENEPVTETKLASLEGGAGLPVTIPQGMRAISVRVNEVVGVAGFVIPGTRVDVFVTLRQQNESVTRVVVSNVQVLTAGTRYDQDKTKTGEPIPSSVVTLLLTPEDAGRVVLASSDGQLMLALRNPLDVAPTATAGTRTGNLFSTGTPVPVAEAGPGGSPKPRVVRPRPVAVEVERQPPPPPPPKPYTVEAIRGAKRSEETIR